MLRTKVFEVAKTKNVLNFEHTYQLTMLHLNAMLNLSIICVFPLKAVLVHACVYVQYAPVTVFMNASTLGSNYLKTWFNWYSLYMDMNTTLKRSGHRV